MTTNVRWHKVGDNWAMAEEGSGEVVARVYQQDGMWLASCFPSLHLLHMGEEQARRRVEAEVKAVGIWTIVSGPTGGSCGRI